VARVVTTACVSAQTVVRFWMKTEFNRVAANQSAPANRHGRSPFHRSGFTAPFSLHLCASHVMTSTAHRISRGIIFALQRSQEVVASLASGYLSSRSCL
jgi:hypothetical protein